MGSDRNEGEQFTLRPWPDVPTRRLRLALDICTFSMSGIYVALMLVAMVIGTGWGFVMLWLAVPMWPLANVGGRLADELWRRAHFGSSDREAES